MKPFYSRLGGKSRSSKLLVSLFPDDYDVYVEPFFGAGSVFFKKPYIDAVEVINDIDNEVFKVLKLVKTKNINNVFNRNISKEYFNSIKKSNKPIHILERLKSSFFGRGKSYNPYMSSLTIATDFTMYKARLKDVIILNEDFRNVINKYDNKNTFFFIDPPYETGGETDYSHYVSPEDVYQAVKNIKGKFMLTYNDSPKIRHIFRNYYINLNNVLYSQTQNVPNRIVGELIITNYRSPG